MSSFQNIKAALTTQLKALSPSLPTEWENSRFVPPKDAGAYQSVSFMPAEPANPTFGGIPGTDMYREEGIFQVMLLYPIGGGAGSPTAKAEAIRDWFPRGQSFSFGSTVVTILRTPRIGPAMVREDRYQLPVSIRYFANVIPS